ncbi:hypothetical protein [Yersinia sp. 2466 StPb PI]|uniref:hypothetical protein n=1 Tax=Yersinia sp. 2466 StPb PI TaxID=3061648 RepID=UPI00355B641A
MKVLKYTGFIVLFFIAVYISAITPYQRFFYLFESEVSEGNIRNAKSGEQYEGKKAGDTIPTIKTLADIKVGSYFTIETESLKPTELYGIVDIQRGGFITSGSGRKKKTKFIPYWTQSKIKTLINELDYARFYIAKLPDGNNVIVLIDDTLLSTSNGDKIRLPIGSKAVPFHVTKQRSGTFAQYFHENAEKYSLNNQTNGYINMASKSFNDTYRLTVLILRIIGTVVIFTILYMAANRIISIFNKKTERNQSNDRDNLISK